VLVANNQEPKKIPGDIVIHRSQIKFLQVAP